MATRWERRWLYRYGKHHRDMGIGKALGILTSLSVTKSHVDHTLVISWREFTPPLEDEVFISRLSLSWDRSAMGIIQNKDEGRTL